MCWCWTGKGGEVRKNESSVQGNREPVDYLENERKREKEDDKKQKERQKGYLALMVA